MDQQPNTILPEISISDQDDWDFLTKATFTQEQRKEEQEQKEEEEKEQPPKDTQTTTASDSESKTTGLTRALSLPRQLNKSTSDDDSIRTEVINIATANPSHLFWVPASQHPEIAPAEFEKYVDAHGLMIRRKSVKRRQSVLSVYFTANDQQKLMEECDTAEAEKDRQDALDALERKKHTEKGATDDSPDDEQEDDNKKHKLILRRSVSLHLPTTGDYPRNVPDLLVFDRNSSPLDESRALVPKGDRPLLRRGARTNFKRNSSVTTPQRNRKSESDSIDPSLRLQQNNLVRSTSAEGGGVTLFDTIDDKVERISTILTEEPTSSLLSPVAENEEVRDLCIATRENNNNNREESISPPAPVVMTRSVSTSTASSSQSRKSAWSWAFWSDEKSSKKNNKIDPNNNVSAVSNAASTAEDEKLNDNTTTSSNKRFTLSSLFSRKSKANNHQNNETYTTNFDSLIDDPKRAPKDFQLNSMHMSRLPLHVERAIYKLSHVKLANPRRPLHEQVLISNQMFWYLSVIASNAPPHQQHSSTTTAAYDMSAEEQQQQQQQQHSQKKIPRKRLVKKQRPVSAPQQPQSKKRSNSHSSTNHNGSNQKGNTTMFMANPRATTESTGFVVPENYLNPKYQQQQEEQGIKKIPTSNAHHNKASSQMYFKKQQQGSDSSSSEDNDDDDNNNQGSDEEEQEEITEKIIVTHGNSHRAKREDDLPLAMYKSSAFKHSNKVK